MRGMLWVARVFLICSGVGLFVCAGCSAPARTGLPVRHTFCAVDSARFASVWQVCQDVLREHRFKIDRLDPRSGLIATDPQTSAHFFEFWRHDTVTASDSWEATVRTVRRSVVIRAHQDETGGQTTIGVEVNRERYARPERQFNHTMAAFRMFGDQLPGEATGKPVSKADDYWIFAGRDLAMERYLLDTIVARAGV